MDVGRKQGGPHFFQGVGHILFAQFSGSVNIAESVGQLVGKAFEHWADKLDAMDSRVKLSLSKFLQLVGGGAPFWGVDGHGNPTNRFSAA